MNHVIIGGLGQIGRAVHELLGTAIVVDINKKEIVDGRVLVMHVCIPYSDDFIKIVKSYQKEYLPEHLLVWSTVPIGTCKKIPGSVHTPVEGRHPHLANSLGIHRRWIGYNVLSDGKYFQNFFYRKGLKTHMIPNTDHTEALKLISTSEYGINLVFADYKKEVANKLNMDYHLMKDWNNDYNELYRQLKMDQFRKYKLDPPNGFIGGHCVRPNAQLLNDQFPDSMLDRIIEKGELE